MTKTKKMFVALGSLMVIALLLSATTSADSVDKAEASHLVSKADKKAKKSSVKATTQEETTINDVKSEVENVESTVGEEEKKLANTLDPKEEAMDSVMGDEEKKLAEASTDSTIEKEFKPSTSKATKTTAKSSTKKIK